MIALHDGVARAAMTIIAGPPRAWLWSCTEAARKKGTMHLRASCLAIALLGPTVACAALDDSTTSSTTSEDGELLGFRSFTERYEEGTLDVGHWALTSNDLRARQIESVGGDPGGYLYGEVSSPIPTWSTVSPRLKQETGPGAVLDSIFVGNYHADQIRRLTADLCVYQAGSWSASRTVTLQIIRWDYVNDAMALEATYSLPDLPTLPVGWQHYAFDVDARASTIPTGWVVTRGDGTPGTDADWSTLMHQVDIVGLGLWKPGYMYPALGLWKIGIDNVHVGTW